MRRLSFILVFGLLITFLYPANSSAISFGCSKAQKDAANYLNMAVSSMKLEADYIRKGAYDTAFSTFQYANKWYTTWQSIVKKSPKCFSGSYVTNNKLRLKSVSVNQIMQSRYGLEIARQYNFGSPDPCFKYLGEDNAYLECSMRNY